MLFEKVECLASTYKVAAWEVNYERGQCIYKGVYFILKSTTSYTYSKKTN